MTFKLYEILIGKSQKEQMHKLITRNPLSDIGLDAKTTFYFITHVLQFHDIKTTCSHQSEYSSMMIDIYPRLRDQRFKSPIHKCCVELKKTTCSHKSNIQTQKRIGKKN